MISSFCCVYVYGRVGVGVVCCVSPLDILVLLEYVSWYYYTASVYDIYTLSLSTYRMENWYKSLAFFVKSTTSFYITLYSDMFLTSDSTTIDERIDMF